MVLAVRSSASPAVPPVPGTYRFEVGSAAEAVATIQARLGAEARVLSVASRPRRGLARLWGGPRYEVVAELPARDAGVPPAGPESGEGVPPMLGVAGSTPDSERSGGTPMPLLDGSRLPALLRRAGFPDRLLARLEASPGWGRALARPLHMALADLHRDLRAASRPPRPLPRRVAFLGGAGAGRSTVLCKMLSHEVIERGATGRVWRVEFGRPNPAPLLDVFGEALGVSVEHYAPGFGAPGAGEGFLFADLPALPVAGSAEDRALLRFLDAEGFEGRVLVLNAAYEPDALRAAYARGLASGATHLVCTHLDETPRWGRLWEFLLEGELSPLFLATGPGLTGDMNRDVVGELLARTLPLRREAFAS